MCIIDWGRSWFLWFNAPPAMVFMGDGSLSMGGTIGAIAVATKHELILIIIGGFVLEALSVLAQVISFKLTGKEYLEWLHSSSL